MILINKDMYISYPLEVLSLVCTRAFPLNNVLGKTDRNYFCENLYDHENFKGLSSSFYQIERNKLLGMDSAAQEL